MLTFKTKTAPTSLILVVVVVVLQVDLLAVRREIVVLYSCLWRLFKKKFRENKLEVARLGRSGSIILNLKPRLS